NRSSVRREPGPLAHPEPLLTLQADPRGQELLPCPPAQRSGARLAPPPAARAALRGSPAAGRASHPVDSRPKGLTLSQSLARVGTRSSTSAESLNAFSRHLCLCDSRLPLVRRHH